MDTLQLLPDSTGYAVTYPNQVVSSGPLDGGAAATRADVIGATGQVDVQWTCDAARANYLESFYRNSVRGANPFNLTLFFGSPDLAVFACKFVGGTFKLSRQQGLTYVYTATLEVYPNADNTAYDSSLVFIYDTFGFDGASQALNRLETLVNIQLQGV